MVRFKPVSYAQTLMIPNYIRKAVDSRDVYLSLGLLSINIGVLLLLDIL